MLEALTQHVVVVGELRITSYRRLTGGGWRVTGCRKRPFHVTRHSALVTPGVACGQANNALGAGQNLLRCDAPGRGALQPGHFTVLFSCQPILKTVCARGSSGGGETAIVKAQFLRSVSDGLFHGFVVIGRAVPCVPA